MSLSFSVMDLLVADPENVMSLLSGVLGMLRCVISIVEILSCIESNCFLLRLLDVSLFKRKPLESHLESPRRFSKVKFYISGANVPGEGELKCIDWVKLTSQAGTEESTIFIGGDADLVLQGMALSRVGAVSYSTGVQEYRSTGAQYNRVH